MKKRIATAIVAIPIVLGAMLCSHPLPFLILAITAFGIGSWEFMSFSGPPDKGLAVSLTLLFAVFAVAWVSFRQGPLDFWILLVVQILGVASLVVSAKAGIQVKRPSLVKVSELFAWVGAPLIAVVLLHDGAWKETNWNPHAPILILFLSLWAGDTTGIFVGMAIGRHKLAPSVSPKKTVEGAIGNFLAGVAVATLIGCWLRLPLWLGTACGIAIGILGQFGDLFESYLKRQADLKDSSGVLPGHGGVLDRIDSLLFSAIPVALLLSLR